MIRILSSCKRPRNCCKRAGSWRFRRRPCTVWARMRADEAVGGCSRRKGGRRTIRSSSISPTRAQLAACAALTAGAGPADGGVLAGAADHRAAGQAGAVSPQVTAGLDTVAVRMPAHPVALGLIAQRAARSRRRARTVRAGRARRWPRTSWEIWAAGSTALSTAGRRRRPGVDSRQGRGRRQSACCARAA